MDKVFAALLSADDAKVLGALPAIEQRGDARSIRPLLHASGARDTAVRQRITGMLYEVKVKDAAAELLAALDVPDLEPVRTTILATFWNAGLDVREHLDVFVSTAIAGTADECFECLTVVENQEIWPERPARTSITRLRNAASSELDEYKSVLLRNMQHALEERLGLGQNTE
ncbi:MAG: hypothetical protein IPL77_04410 [Flavobacteriales bacterium]|nr:hypothetical protein [Flavobacteriales bacterium]